jgi:hypothetical protein
MGVGVAVGRPNQGAATRNATSFLTIPAETRPRPPRAPRAGRRDNDPP